MEHTFDLTYEGELYTVVAEYTVSTDSFRHEFGNEPTVEVECASWALFTGTSEIEIKTESLDDRFLYEIDQACENEIVKHGAEWVADYAQHASDCRDPDKDYDDSRENS